MVSTKILNSTNVFIIDNNKKCFFSTILYQHIRLISEGSFNTEEWSNGCCMFDLINAALQSIRDFLKNIKKDLTDIC